MQLQDALKRLTQFVSSHCYAKPWVLVDKYDAPLQAGHKYNYASQIVPLVRNIFCSAFQPNPYLGKAIMMGVCEKEEAKEFLGLNDLIFHSVLTSKYGSYFSFSELEVDNLLKMTNLLEKSKKIKEACLYDYQIDKKNIYHPSLIMQFIQQEEAKYEKEKFIQMTVPALG